MKVFIEYSILEYTWSCLPKALAMVIANRKNDGNTFCPVTLPIKFVAENDDEGNKDSTIVGKNLW